MSTRALTRQLTAYLIGQYPGASTRGYAAFLRRLLKDVPLSEEEKEALQDASGVVPDAWQYVPEDRTLVLFEIEVAHALPEWKAGVYSDLESVLVEHEYDLVVGILDRYASLTFHHPDMLFYLASIRRGKFPLGALR